MLCTVPPFPWPYPGRSNEPDDRSCHHDFRHNCDHRKRARIGRYEAVSRIADGVGFWPEVISHRLFEERGDIGFFSVAARKAEATQLPGISLWCFAAGTRPNFIETAERLLGKGALQSAKALRELRFRSWTGDWSSHNGIVE
jgi:hypothetical protein